MSQRRYRGNKKYLEINENRKTMVQNLWDTSKAVLKGKFIEIQAYLEKQEKPQTIQLYTESTRRPKFSYQKEGYNEDQSGNK